MKYICGVDEAGRGSLSGPVAACACLLSTPDIERDLLVKDSKLLSPKQREKVVEKYRHVPHAVCFVPAGVIDEINIRQASLFAMQGAVEELGKSYLIERVFVDGVDKPDVVYPVTAVIHGDRSVPIISLASIFAKVTRDGYMIEMDRTYPDYGWKSNKGYCTEGHQQALVRCGVTPLHRKSFAPVAALLGGPNGVKPGRTGCVIREESKCSQMYRGGRFTQTFPGGVNSGTSS